MNSDFPKNEQGLTCWRRGQRVALAGAILAGAPLAGGCQCSSDTGDGARIIDRGGRDASPDFDSTVDGGRSPVGTRDGGYPDATTHVDAAHDAAVSVADAVAPEDASTDAATIDATLPVSLYCGDGIRGPTEQCDDGNADETDFCTSTCEARDEIAALTPLPITISEKRMMVGRQRMSAAGKGGAAVLFIDAATSPYSLGMVVMRPDGGRWTKPNGLRIDDENPIFDEYDVAVAALPGNQFATVWPSNGGDSDGVGVVMRGVDGASGALTETRTVNTTALGLQTDVDTVWTGTQLVVAWTDSGTGLNQQYPRYQRFDRSLQPVGAEQRITALGEYGVAPVLCPFGGDFAVAWVEFDTNFDRIYHARAGSSEWAVGAFALSAGAHVTLAALDATHLFLVVEEPRNVDGGQPQVRLWGALLDTAAPGEVPWFPIEPIVSGSPSDPYLTQSEASLAVADNSAFVAWYQYDLNGGALLLKRMPWTVTGGHLNLESVRPRGAVATRRGKPRWVSAIPHARCSPVDGGQHFVRCVGRWRTDFRDQRETHRHRGAGNPSADAAADGRQP